ncbi:TetR family transcriptional regulator [Arthrobacter halodurans]|uniref:TetR family transcriptional regulator n=1 Tax=Arthrobacter halodurans TaxID=516699 RepID=A0ABV4UQS6_9MICC
MNAGSLSDDGSPAPTRPAGRPATIDPDAVAALALRLFAERGYERTSMEDIARAAGIARKSLYRYFASKADLVWGGMDPVLEASGGAPGTGGDHDGDLLAWLRRVAVAGAATIPDLSVARGRLRIIAAHPELASRGHEALAPQRTSIRDHLLARGCPPDAADYVSAAYIGVTFAAWTRWAAGTDPDPAPYLTAALDVLRLPGHAP